MGRPEDDEREEEEGPEAAEREPVGGRPNLTRRDTWRLVFATYKTSFPYLLIFVIAMLAATWFVTTVVFR